MAVNSLEERQDSYCILVSPDEGTTTTVPRFESPLTFHSYPERDNPLENQICLDGQIKSENNAAMENVDLYPHSILDIGVDNVDSRMLIRNNSETSEKLKIEEMFKNESPLMKVLQRQISLPVGEKLVKLLMNDRFVLPRFTCTDKSASEKMHETPTYRSKKYKRSTSFSSRKVVLLFSVLSSLGTMVLIYLTLRVRQMGDNYLHT